MKHQLYIGFITGLAPCLFGWSLFLLFLSTGKIWSIIPLIAFFGLGIFAALSLIALLIVKFKLKIFDSQHWIGEISPVISALTLLMFSIAQIV